MYVQAILLYLVIIENIAATENTSLEMEKTNNTASSEIKYENILSNLLIGYSCDAPEDIISHKMDSLDDCEDHLIKKKTRPAKFQVLQEARTYANTGIVCTLKRTRRMGECGAYHHLSGIFEEEYTLKNIQIDPEICKAMYEQKVYKPPYPKIKGFPISLNKQNRVQYYVKGAQYPYHSSLEGPSVMCDGNAYRFTDSEVTVKYMIIHHEDIISVSDATLAIDEENKMLHKESQLVLKHCTPTQKNCFTEDGTYIWINKPPRCSLRTTKTVRGEVITLENDKSYFIGNYTLIHLELKGFETKCRRKIYYTNFQNIFPLDVEKE